MAEHAAPSDKGQDYIAHITLDDTALAARSPEIEHERRVAIFDLIENNHFRLRDGAAGPYHISLSPGDRGVLLNVCDVQGNPLRMIEISLRPLRRNIRDYFIICENYFEAIRHGAPERIEAIDNTRRALHNESAALLKAALAENAELDRDTARRLFTLISVLHTHG